MKKSRRTEHQIVLILNEVKASIPVNDVCKRPGRSVGRNELPSMAAHDINESEELATVVICNRNSNIFLCDGIGLFAFASL